jgi:hypothetical protein
MKHIFFTLIVVFAIAFSAQAQVDRTQVVWDSLIVMPPGWPESNPYNILYSMNCSIKPALDHTGKPHHHGHVVQLIMDGGNNIQDPPNPDGTPGGDDSLAFGNFNMIRVLGVDGSDDPNGQTGTFYSKKFFVPQTPPGRGYYLRLWEGADPATAPYYQDTIEYTTDDDRGGALIRLKSGMPHDVDWAFGPSQPRPEIPKSGKGKK